MQGFPVLHDNSVKGLKNRDMVENAWGKIPENLDFVENSKFITESAEAAVCECFGENSVESLWWSPIIVKLQSLTLYLYHNRVPLQVTLEDGCLW